MARKRDGQFPAPTSPGNVQDSTLIRQHNVPINWCHRGEWGFRGGGGWGLIGWNKDWEDFRVKGRLISIWGNEGKGVWLAFASCLFPMSPDLVGSKDRPVVTHGSWWSWLDCSTPETEPKRSHGMESHNVSVSVSLSWMCASRSWKKKKKPTLKTAFVIAQVIHTCSSALTEIQPSVH